jgi:hypothetical protein
MEFRKPAHALTHGSEADPDVRSGTTARSDGSNSAAPERLVRAGPDRDRRLDLYRGVALWWIFLDHVPDNVGGWLTLRNFGFSDAAEIFMFVSGMTCAIAYGKTLRRDGWSGVVKRTVRRAWQIYVAFMLLTVACAVLVHLAGVDRFADESNTRVLLDHPGASLARAAILQYRPVNTDVLPLFVAFHLVFAPLLWRLLRWPSATLVGSVLLYVLASRFGWSLPGRPYFNPLAWQLLVVFGAWYAVAGGRPGSWFSSCIVSPAVRAAAGLFLCVGLAVSAANWSAGSAPALAWAVHLDKTNLDPLRLLHFASLAVVAAWLVPRDWSHMASPAARAAILCGENSLPVFCVGVLLALGGRMILVQVADGPAAQVAVSTAGIVLMVAVAALLRAGEVGRRPLARGVWEGGAVEPV